MKQIDLQIKRELLEKIISGEKLEDYRIFSRYNCQLLSVWQTDKLFVARKDVTHVRFVSGLSDKKKFAICEIGGIFIDKFVEFVPEGVKPDSMAFTIEIRRVVEHNL